MNSYSVKNIKSFREEARVDVKPITIFVGKNSCGKSSLIRFPVILAQSMNSDADIPLVFLGKNLDYGNYEDVVFGHKKKEGIGFSVDYECVPGMYYYGDSRDNKYYRRYASSTIIRFEIELAKYSRRMIIDKCDVQIEDKKCISISREQKEKYVVKIYDIDNPDYSISVKPKHVRFYKFIPLLLAEEMFELVLDAYYEQEEISETDKAVIKEKIKKYMRGLFCV